MNILWKLCRDLDVRGWSNHVISYCFSALALLSITLRIAHLRIAHWGGNPEVGNSESISHQDCPPQLLSFWWIVFAWYRPRVNARDTDSILNYNFLKNNIFFAIWEDFINHTVKKSLTTTLSWWRWYMVDFFSGRTDHIKSGDKLSSVIVNKQ